MDLTSVSDVAAVDGLRAPARTSTARRRTMSPHHEQLAARFDDVLAAARHGSSWAWQQILSAYGPRVQAYARSQGVDDPENLLGHVVEGVVRGIDRFKGDEARFRSWVFTIAHSRIVDDRRRTARRPQMQDQEPPDVPDVAGDAYEASDHLSRAAALALLEGLPAKQRDVVALRVVAGLSVDETARVLNRRPGTVRVAMHRALQSLQTHPDIGDVTP